MIIWRNLKMLKRRTDQLVSNVKESIKAPVRKQGPISVDNVISSGSTLLDLAISGKRRHGGGIPTGILMEIFGPAGFGKTSLLVEIGASAQHKGGFFLVGDAERRLDKEYARIYGLEISKDNYKVPHSISDVEELILGTPPSGKGIDVIGIDSIASLVSEQDQSKDGDKRGSARAKELHQLCRKAKGEVAKKERLVVFTNQIQDVQDGSTFGPREKTPGGHAVPFYSSLRIRIGPSANWKIKKKIIVKGKEIQKTIGIRPDAYIFKSTIDEPYREIPLYIIFNYGIDDLRGNLVYLKQMTGAKMYPVVDKELHSLEDAIHYAEENDLQKDIREEVIEVWNEIEDKFQFGRKPKVRF